MPGGGVLLARGEVTDAYLAFGDLFLVDDEGERRLTTGLRGSEVDVAPDGSAAVFVQRGQGRTRLARIAMRDAAEPELLFDPGESQVYTPRFSPDGRSVVFARTRAAHGRDLFLLDLRTRETRQLTDDGALDLDRVFTPDGTA